MATHEAIILSIETQIRKGRAISVAAGVALLLFGTVSALARKLLLLLFQQDESGGTKIPQALLKKSISNTRCCDVLTKQRRRKKKKVKQRAGAWPTRFKNLRQRLSLATTRSPMDRTHANTSKADNSRAISKNTTRQHKTDAFTAQKRDTATTTSKVEFFV